LIPIAKFLEIKNKMCAPSTVAPCTAAPLAHPLVRHCWDGQIKFILGLSGGSRGELGGAIAPPNAQVSPPPNSPPKMNDGPYIKRLNAYDIAK